MQNRRALVFASTLLIAMSTCAARPSIRADAYANKNPLYSRVFEKRDAPPRGNFANQLLSTAFTGPTAGEKQPAMQALQCKYDKKENALVTPDGKKVYLLAMGITGKVIDIRYASTYILILTTNSFATVTYCVPFNESGAPGTRSELIEFKGKKLKFGRIINDYAIIGMFSDGRIAKITTSLNSDSALWEYKKGSEKQVLGESKPVLEIFDDNTFLVIFPSFRQGVMFRFLKERILELEFALKKPFDAKTTVVKTKDGFEIKFRDGTVEKIPAPPATE